MSAARMEERGSGRVFQRKEKITYLQALFIVAAAATAAGTVCYVTFGEWIRSYVRAAVLSISRVCFFSNVVRRAIFSNMHA